MISELKERLEAVFTQEKLDTIGKLLTWGPGHLQFEAHETTGYPPQLNCHIFRPRLGNLDRYDLASFSFEEFPFNGDILVSGRVEIARFQRGFGLGNLLQAERIAAAKAAGASALVCTVNASNEVERKVLFSHGWKQTGQFTSHFGTDHQVEFWMKEL